MNKQLSLFLLLFIIASCGEDLETKGPASSTPWKELYRTDNWNYDAPTIHLVYNLHPWIEDPYLWKEQVEIFEYLMDKFEKDGYEVDNIFAEFDKGRYNLYYIPGGITESVKNGDGTFKEGITINDLSLSSSTEWNAQYVEVLVSNPNDSKIKEYIKEVNKGLWNGIYPFGNLEPKLITLNGYEQAIPLAAWTAELAAQDGGRDGLTIYGVEDKDKLAESRSLDNAMRDYINEKKDLNSDEFKGMEASQRSKIGERNQDIIFNARKFIDDPATGIRDVVYITGGLHLDGVGENNLPKLFEDIGYNVVLIKPNSYDSLLKVWMEKNGFDTSLIGKETITSPIGTLYPNEKTLIASAFPPETRALATLSENQEIASG